jgi:hypothetical protein
MCHVSGVTGVNHSVLRTQPLFDSDVVDCELQSA